MKDTYWFSSIRPRFPGKIGSGMNFNRKTKRDPYRSAGARERRRLRREYRKAPRVPGLSFKGWLELRQEQAV